MQETEWKNVSEASIWESKNAKMKSHHKNEFRMHSEQGTFERADVNSLEHLHIYA